MLHASLTDQNFVAFHNLAESKNMSAKELLEAIVIAELHRVSVVKSNEIIEGS